MKAITTETEHREGWHPIETAPKDGRAVRVSAGETGNLGATPEAIARYVKFGGPAAMFERAAELIDESDAYNKPALLHYIHQLAEHRGWEPIDNPGAEYCGPKWWQPLELPRV